MIEINNDDRLLILEALEILIEDLENDGQESHLLWELEELYKKLDSSFGND